MHIIVYWKTDTAIAIRSESIDIFIRNVLGECGTRRSADEKKIANEMKKKLENIRSHVIGFALHA